MYSMFMPPTGGIFVPIRAMNWNWSGHAVFQNNVWSLQNPAANADVNDFDVYAHPQWSTNTSGILSTWQQQ